MLQPIVPTLAFGTGSVNSIGKMVDQSQGVGKFSFGVTDVMNSSVVSPFLKASDRAGSAKDQHNSLVKGFLDNHQGESNEQGKEAVDLANEGKN